ncbi:MAG: hypothetical protein AB7G24_14690 [Novosphingobium sp.]
MIGDCFVRGAVAHACNPAQFNFAEPVLASPPRANTQSMQR